MTTKTVNLPDLVHKMKMVNPLTEIPMMKTVKKERRLDYQEVEFVVRRWRCYDETYPLNCHHRSKPSGNYGGSRKQLYP
jgi:inorganic pyrophosphatase